jgi:hypothetical protein
MAIVDPFAVIECRRGLPVLPPAHFYFTCVRPVPP